MGLKIVLKLDHTEYRNNDRQHLVFTLINDSEENVRVLKLGTPFDGINSDMFEVEKEGKLAVYMGRVVKRGPIKLEDYLHLGPRESKSVELDLTDAYDIFEPGEYEVKFTRLLDVQWKEAAELEKELTGRHVFSPYYAQSNIAKFKLLEPRNPRQINGISVEWLKQKKNLLERTSFEGCSSDREQILRDSLTEAQRIADESLTALHFTPEESRPNSTRYITWFGTYDRERYYTVTSNFESISNALAFEDIKFNCNCDENYYAYVYPTRPYEIFLCNQFWTAPLSGTDSTSGTLVHEISHFNIVAGTEDNAYGQADCASLASTDPSAAINNADSHGYFAENNPSLSM